MNAGSNGYCGKRLDDFVSEGESQADTTSTKEFKECNPLHMFVPNILG